MALFCTILLTMFIAEMGDKTQLLLVAMTSRFKLRDIIIGSAASILVLNGLAVGVGSKSLLRWPFSSSPGLPCPEMTRQRTRAAEKKSPSSPS